MPKNYSKNKSYIDRTVKFHDLWDKPINELIDLLLDDRDVISKRYIAKQANKYYKNYNLSYSLSSAYNDYYKTKLWLECCSPILRMIGIKSKKIGYRKFDFNNQTFHGYICLECEVEYISETQITPDHIKYPTAVSYGLKRGWIKFDSRIKLNHPKHIEFKCINCHQKRHEM